MKNLPHNERRELELLRQLLVGSELDKLDQLSDRLDNREAFSSEIGDVLPQAMLKSANQRGHQLSKALVPTVEDIVRISIKRDINKFADALFPVIGPAIRKSVIETIRQMFRSVNQVIENSFSIQGLRWRIESMRTGVPFAQIVLSNSLVYEVEQVFLIHHSTGLLLTHIERENVESQNPDVVSSMLTAIDDFVSDSFENSEEKSLGSIEMGSISIWLVKSPNAILALAITGNPPASLHTTMLQTMEQIELVYDDDFAQFNGDISVFEPAKDILHECLQEQYQNVNRRFGIGFWIACLVVIAALFYWVGSGLYQSKLQKEYISLLEKEPGYAITGFDNDGGVFRVKGLRDPLARTPQAVLNESRLNFEAVAHVFQPYQSLEQTLVLKRALAMMSLPTNVSASIDDGRLLLSGYADEEWINAINRPLLQTTGVAEINTDALVTSIDLSSLIMPESVEAVLDIGMGRLQVSGFASPEWRNRAEALALQIPGIHFYDDSALKEAIDLSLFSPPDSVVLTLEESVLKVQGRAELAWIASMQKLARTYPSISRIDSSSLTTIEAEMLAADIQRLEEKMIFFDASVSFNFEFNQTLDEVAEIVSRIIANSKILSKQVQVVVKGFSDSSGSFEDNKFLSEDRADYVSQYLFNTGISPSYLRNEGLKEPVEVESTEEQRQFNRRVEFAVELNRQVSN